MAIQLPLPLETGQHFSRDEFIVGPANQQAVEFIDSWPEWPAPSAVLYGPKSSGKTHLSRVWAEMSGAVVVSANKMDESLDGTAFVVEDVSVLSDAAERMMFSLIEGGYPLLITSRVPPTEWPVKMPDLSSRYNALLSFSMWAPDDEMLNVLAQMLFAVRQLSVPQSVANEMVKSLERSPAAMRDFVAEADREALARKRPVSLSLVKELLAKHKVSL